MADKGKIVEQFYIPPVKVGNWKGFKTFMWNGETSQFMGRTGSSWAKILLFYVIFYAALIGFFAAMLAVFYTTIDNRIPKWQLDESVIGSNPGLGFRPMPPDSMVESTLIWYDHSIESSWKQWTTAIDKFINETFAENKLVQPNALNCTDSNRPSSTQFCRVPLNLFGNCVSSTNYKYDKQKPCIFLKLNKIYNWIPLIYNSSNLPNEMPLDLKDHIKELEMSRASTNVVWVSCEGENSADREHIGPINYSPARGFPAFYFPYTNVEGYLPPVVAVQFDKPATGVVINIECKAWAHNIKHDRADRRGSVHFELMID